MVTKEKGNGIWSWLRDEANRKIIAWFGSGIVVVASGLWIAYEKSNSPEPTSNVTIHGNGIAAGRDVNTGPVTFGD